MKQSYKTALLWVFLIVMFVALWKVFDQKSTPVKPLNWSQFMAKVESGEVKDVSVKELDYTGHMRDGSEFTTTGPLDAAAVVAQKLVSKDITLRYEKPEQASLLGAGGLPVAAAGLHLPALLLLHAAAAVGRRQGHELRQVARQAADRAPQQGHLRRRRRHRRGEGRARGDHRLPQGPEEVHRASAAASPRACC